VLGGSLGEAHADKIARTIEQAAAAGSRSSASTTPAARASRRASPRSTATARSSAPTSPRRAASPARAHPRAVRRRRGVLAGADGLHDHDRRGVHVPHRPRVVKAVTGEDVDARSLGGPEVHADGPGAPTSSSTTTRQAFATARELLGYLPSSASAPPAEVAPEPPPPVDLRDLVPSDGREPYDVRDVIRGSSTAAASSRCRRWARNLVIGFARIDGRTVGVVANQARGSPACSTSPPREGRPVRALLRRVRDPARGARRRARLPARHRAGATAA
jgi:hypothetical protein